MKSDSGTMEARVLFLINPIKKNPTMFNFILSLAQGRPAATVFEQSTFMCFLFTKALAETYTERYTTK